MSTEEQPKKKLKTDDEEKGKWAVMMTKMEMQRLAQRWNSEGTCPFTGNYLGGEMEQQRPLLGDMKEICRQGSASYENPYGEDDRESFGNTFANEFTVQEQKFFLALATTSLEDKKPIPADKIEEYLLEGPFLPFHVSLKENEKKKRFENGSERFPFSTFEQGKEYWIQNHVQLSIQISDQYDDPLIKVVCGNECPQKECFLPWL